MKITISNTSSREISTDFGLLRVGANIVVNDITPDQAFNAASSLKPMVDDGMINVEVATDLNRLDILEPVVIGILQSNGAYSQDSGITAQSGAHLVGILDQDGLLLSDNVEDALQELANTVSGLDRIAQNVPVFANPGAATAADAANKINDIIIALRNAGLMIPPN